ncbi:hypothetical protein SD78_3289 [Bacillus badius]|nr:hypothetical protein SD78_3289 [Bacillus badius]
MMERLSFDPFFREKLLSNVFLPAADSAQKKEPSLAGHHLAIWKTPFFID